MHFNFFSSYFVFLKVYLSVNQTNKILLYRSNLVVQPLRLLDHNDHGLKEWFFFILVHIFFFNLFLTLRGCKDYWCSNNKILFSPIILKTLILFVQAQNRRLWLKTLCHICSGLDGGDGGAGLVRGGGGRGPRGGGGLGPWRSGAGTWVSGARSPTCSSVH